MWDTAWSSLVELPRLLAGAALGDLYPQLVCESGQSLCWSQENLSSAREGQDGFVGKAQGPFAPASLWACQC